MRSKKSQPLARYQHFKDPVGLLMRMVRSGNGDAAFTLTRAALEVLAAPVDLVSRPIERRFIRTADRPLLPIVQIVGPPRSGTTLAYQTLSHSLPYGYFDNLNSLFQHSTITAARVFGSGRRKAPRQTHSYYGNTSGFRGTNDGFYVWDRWLGQDRGRVVEPLSDAVKEEMRRFFRAWFEHSPRPLLTKHNRNMLCMETLLGALPSTIYVLVTRDPVYTAQSLLIAREKIQGDRRIGWGHGAHLSADSPAAVDPILDVARHVRSIFDKLKEQVKRVPAERLLWIRYEQFCRDPGRCAIALHEMVRRHWPAAADLDPPVPVGRSFDTESRVHIRAAEFERLHALLADLRDEHATSGNFQPA